jgi:hypothetical protein
VLRAPWRLTRECQPLLIAQNVDGRRFARVRAPRESDLGLSGGRKIAQVIDGREEARLVEQEGHEQARIRDAGEPGVGTGQARLAS